MPELRHDPIQKRWVIIAADRALRPSDFSPQVEMVNGERCPFCEGNEDDTPDEIVAFRTEESKPDTPGWEVRVVANKYPALTIEGKLNRRGAGIYDVINGIGAHEVIVETTRHDLRMADYPVDHLTKVVHMYRERLEDLKGDGRFRYILVFKNDGQEAGASLSHSHTQLIATPVTPRIVAAELENGREYFHTKERCLFCDIINQELESGERIVARNDHFVAMCPFAARFPFELIILPLRHCHDYTEIGDEEAVSFAAILKDVLGRLKRGLNDPAYNFMLHTSPNTETIPRRPGYWGTLAFDYHWHLEVMPRITSVAGFEWGTGFYINPVRPELAARHLREAGS